MQELRGKNEDIKFPLVFAFANCKNKVAVHGFYNGFNFGHDLTAQNK